MDTSAKSIPVAKSVLIYAVAFAVAGATPFVLLPILTKMLSPKEFGEATSFLIMVAMVGNIAGLSSHGFVSVRYFKSGSVEFKRIVANAILSVCGAHALVLALVPFLFPQLRRLIYLPLGLMLLAVVSALLVSLNLIFLSIYQASGQPWLYLRARLVQGFVELILCIGFIFLVSSDSGARIFSYAAAVAASAMVGIYYCRAMDYLGTGVSKQNLRELFAFGLPMIPHILAGTVLTYIDRVMVSSILGVDSLGIYMVSMQIGMAMIVVIEPLNKALAPWLFEHLAKNDRRVNLMVVRNTYFFYLGLAILGLIVTALSHVLFDAFIGIQYANAKALVPWMVAGFVFQGMYYSVVNYLFYAEKTGKLSTVSSGSAVFGALMSYALISNFGMVGAGISFAFNNLILFILVWLVASRVVSMPWLLDRRKPQ